MTAFKISYLNKLYTYFITKCSIHLIDEVERDNIEVISRKKVTL